MMRGFVIFADTSDGVHVWCENGWAPSHDARPRLYSTARYARSSLRNNPVILETAAGAPVWIEPVTINTTDKSIPLWKRIFRLT